MNDREQQDRRAIGRRIIASRQALGLDRRAFARACGITQPALSNYERGIRCPNIDSAVRISRLLGGAYLDWLYIGDLSALPPTLRAKLSAFDRPDLYLSARHARAIQ